MNEKNTGKSTYPINATCGKCWDREVIE